MRTLCYDRNFVSTDFVIMRFYCIEIFLRTIFPMSFFFVVCFFFPWELLGIVYSEEDSHNHLLSCCILSYSFIFVSIDTEDEVVEGQEAGKTLTCCQSTYSKLITVILSFSFIFVSIDTEDEVVEGQEAGKTLTCCQSTYSKLITVTLLTSLILFMYDGLQVQNNTIDYLMHVP